VSSGETLGGIAKRYGVSAVALAQANGLASKVQLRIGQILKLPAEALTESAAGARDTPKASEPEVSVITHVVGKGETLSAIAKRYGVTVAALTSENALSRTATLRVGQRLSIPKSK
jgi:LysM repeat protein